MKRNVVAFYNTAWFTTTVMSGGDQMFMQILKRIRNQLGELWCVTSPVGERAVKKEVSEVRFLTSPLFFDRFGMLGSYVLRSCFALRCLSLRPDVVYSSSDFFPDVVPAFVLKLFRPNVRWIQCVFHIYPDWRKRPGSKIKNFVGQYMQKFSLRLARRADVIVNINQQVKSYLVANGFQAGRIVINPPGIDPGALNAIPAASTDEAYDGIFLGRLNVNKGALDLIEIWARVRKRSPHARLGIIGGGDNEIMAEIKARISQYGIESDVDLLGYLEDKRAFSLLKTSKVFLFPSREEGFGIAIVEAMQCGLPVVAWKLPVYAEYFSGAMDVIDTEDYEAFASQVARYLGNPQQRAEQLPKGKLCAANFTWDVTARNFFACVSSSPADSAREGQSAC